MKCKLDNGPERIKPPERDLRKNKPSAINNIPLFSELTKQLKHTDLSANVSLYVASFIKAKTIVKFLFTFFQIVYTVMYTSDAVRQTSDCALTRATLLL